MEREGENTLEKLKALTLGEKILAIAGLVLFIDSFLSWYSVSIPGVSVGNIHVGGVSVTRSGWQSPGAFFSIIAVLIALVLVAQIIVAKLELAELPDKLGNFSWGQIHLVGAGVVLALIIIKWLNEHRAIAYGFWIGLLAAIAMVVGAYFIYQERAGATPPAA